MAKKKAKKKSRIQPPTSMPELPPSSKIAAERGGKKASKKRFGH